MKIYAFTGTGNSLWVARTIHSQLVESTIETMPWLSRLRTMPEKAIGLVFPVHIWGIPGRVQRMVKFMDVASDTYLFAVAVNGGQVAATLPGLGRLLENRGLKLSAGFSIVMPSNYIPWGGPGPLEKRQKLYTAAQIKANEIATFVRERAQRPLEKGSLWQNVLLSGAFYHAARPVIHRMDENFKADVRCNGCGTCVRVCPAANIVLSDKRPAWQTKCEQCFACLQWCPQAAIQFGPKTRAYERYHHPQVTLRDLEKQAWEGRP